MQWGNKREGIILFDFRFVFQKTHPILHFTHAQKQRRLSAPKSPFSQMLMGEEGPVNDNNDDNHHHGNVTHVGRSASCEQHRLKTVKYLWYKQD